MRSMQIRWAHGTQLLKILYCAHLCKLHGGLICVAFRLSVRLSVTNITLDNNSYLVKYCIFEHTCAYARWALIHHLVYPTCDLEVKGHVGQGQRLCGYHQKMIPKNGRWAHTNVKLLHFYYSGCDSQRIPRPEKHNGKLR